MITRQFVKRAVSIFVAGAMAVSLAACGGNKEASTSGNAGAGAEAGNAGAGTEAAGSSDVSGKVVIYTSMYEDIIDNMETELEKVFPDLDVEFFQGGSGTIQSKIAAEMDAGKMGCDILMVAEPSYALQLKEAGILHPHPFAEADKLVFDYDPDGYWCACM